MAAAIPGTLAWVAEPGTWVRAGEAIARIDAEELRLQRAEQQARLKRIEVNLEQAERELKRLQGSGNAVSQFQLDQARATRDLVSSDLAIARVSLRQTEERLSRTELRSPFAGVVSERLQRIGEEVSRGDVVARVLDPQELEIRLFVPLRHLRAVQPGAMLTATGELGAFQAKVHSVIPAGTGRAQSFEVLAEAPRDQAWLAPGQLLRVELPLGNPAQKLAVPRDALVLRREGHRVVRIDGAGRAEWVPVTLGAGRGDWIAVEGELAAGERVAIRGAERLQPGQAVQILADRAEGRSPDLNPGAGAG